MAFQPPTPSKKELKLFEKLENMTKHESFDSAATFVRKFIDGNVELNNSYQSIGDDDEEDNGDENDVAPPFKENIEDLSSIYSVEEEDTKSGEDDGDGGEEMHDDDGDNNNGVEKRVKKGTISWKDLLEEVIADENEEEEDDDDEASSAPDQTGQLSESSYSSDEDDFVEGLKLKESTAYLLLSEMKRSLELQEMQLNRERKVFAEEKSSEEQELVKQKQILEDQKKNVESLGASYSKMKATTSEQEARVKDLTEKLRQTKLEMDKRINRWSYQQRKLEERVKTLEKENSELKKQKSLHYRPSNLKRPSTLAASSKPAAQSQQNGRKSILQQNSCPRKIRFDNNVTADGTNLTSAAALSTNDGGKPKNNNAIKKVLENKEEDENKENPANMTLANDDSDIGNNDKPCSEGSSTRRKTQTGNQCPREVSIDDDNADKTMPSDYVEVKHACGTITRITKDRGFTRHIMMNKDIMEEFEDCSVRYYYAEHGFSQTTYPNGDEIIEYDSGVIETQRADGTKIYTYNDGLVKLIDPLKREEVYFPDGSVMKKDGVESIITWPNGQKEVRTPQFVKRIYSTGTIKIRYSDGAEETRYWNGRIRRKDKNGTLVDDTTKTRRKNVKKAVLGEDEGNNRINKTV